MSGILSGKVWLSALDADLKPLAATLADIGSDDGRRIYPSVAYMAWRLSRSEREVQRGLAKLREMGVLVVVGNAKGGRGKVTRYHLVEAALPPRAAWGEDQDSDEFTEEERVTQRVTEIDERVTSTTKRVTPTSPDPLVVQPLEEPLVEPLAEKVNRTDVVSSEPYFPAFRTRWRAATGVGCPKGAKEEEFAAAYIEACTAYGEDEVLSMVDAYGVENAEWIKKYHATPKKFFEELAEIAEARRIVKERKSADIPWHENPRFNLGRK